MQQAQGLFLFEKFAVLPVADIRVIRNKKKKECETVSEQKKIEIAEQPMPNVIGNKFKVVLAAAEEAKKLKQQDTDKTASLGKIAIAAMFKVLTKANKKQDKADEIAELEENEQKEKV